MPIWNVTTTVEREVNADTEEEAIQIAEKLVLAMPHLDNRVCSTDPDVYSDAAQLESSPSVRKQFAATKNWPPMNPEVKEFLAQFAGKPYVAPGYNAPVDPDEPHPDLVDVPDVDAKIAHQNVAPNRVTSDDQPDDHPSTLDAPIEAVSVEVTDE